MYIISKTTEMPIRWRWRVVIIYRHKQRADAAVRLQRCLTFVVCDLGRNAGRHKLQQAGNGSQLRADWSTSWHATHNSDRPFTLIIQETATDATTTSDFCLTLLSYAGILRGLQYKNLYGLLVQIFSGQMPFLPHDQQCQRYGFNQQWTHVIILYNKTRSALAEQASPHYSHQKDTKVVPYLIQNLRPELIPDFRQSAYVYR